MSARQQAPSVLLHGAITHAASSVFILEAAWCLNV
jgi:hypothetical protein